MTHPIPQNLQDLTTKQLHDIAALLDVKVNKKDDNKTTLIEKLGPAITKALTEGVLQAAQEGATPNANVQGAQPDAVNPAPNGEQTDPASADGQQAAGQGQEPEVKADVAAPSQSQAEPVAAGEPKEALKESKYAAIAELIDSGSRVEGYEYVRESKVATNHTVTPTDYTKTDPLTHEVYVLCKVKGSVLHASRL